jgi:hypothetical protein
MAFGDGLGGEEVFTLGKLQLGHSVDISLALLTDWFS